MDLVDVGEGLRNVEGEADKVGFCVGEVMGVAVGEAVGNNKSLTASTNVSNAGF